jgi:hypothetical protein
MVAWSQLALPVLVSTGLVFVASSVIHMVLKWHKPDYRKLPNEDEVRDAIRKGAPAPGQYLLPHMAEPAQMKDPEMVRRFQEGPVGVLYVDRSGPRQLGPFLGRWIVYTAVVGGLVAYVARVTLPSGAPYLSVFRVVGAVAWLAYAWQGPSDSIWKGKPWSVTAREWVDGLVYASLTAGAFGWLWPR